MGCWERREVWRRVVGGPGIERRVWARREPWVCWGVGRRVAGADFLGLSFGSSSAGSSWGGGAVVDLMRASMSFMQAIFSTRVDGSES